MRLNSLCEGPKPSIERLLVCEEEADLATEQHHVPCRDCPLRRNSLPGWLGGNSVDDLLSALHGDGRIECHSALGAECAGAAIYRATVAKRPRNECVLRLPPNRVDVFATPAEFRKYHERPNLRAWEKANGADV